MMLHSFAEQTTSHSLNVTLPLSPHLFWYCKNCREVFRATPFDEVPRLTVQDGALVEEPLLDEREEFLRRHRHHRLGLLKRVRDKILSDCPAWDPMRTVYEEVTDGRETFLLKSWREDISAPRRYLLLSGSLVVEGTSVTLEEELLRSALRQSCSFPAETLDRLVAVIQKTVATLSPDDLIPAHCSETDPELSFAYLPDHHLTLLLRRCRQVVSEAEVARLRGFFHTQQHSEELSEASVSERSERSLRSKQLSEASVNERKRVELAESKQRSERSLQSKQLSVAVRQRLRPHFA